MNSTQSRLLLVGFLALAIAAVVAVVIAISGGGDDDDAPPEGATGSPSASTPVAEGTPGEISPAEAEATELALSSAFRHLGFAVLGPGDVPAGYQQRSNAAISRQDAVASNVLSIRLFAEYLDASDLRALWGTLYTRPTNDAALSSLVYEFGSTDGAQGMVLQLSSLTQAAYPATKSVERVQSDKITPDAQMMLYVLEGTGTLEYSWTQGRYAGQVILRFVGETPPPEEVTGVVALARVQLARMESLPQ